MEDFSVITLGFFDSVHLGHIKVINRCVELAKIHRATPILITFDDNFPNYLNYDNPHVIYTLEERKELYSNLGIQKVIVLPSTDVTMSQSIEDFHVYLDTFLNLKGIVVGEDFSYGKLALGNIKTLGEYAKTRNIPFDCVDFARKNGEKIGTTGIKSLILSGYMETASSLLGRDFYLDGVVVHGRGDGHCFDIPTANIECDAKKLIPAYGVYATIAEFEGKSHLSLTNIGTQPTFDSDHFAIECMILDFKGDIYGKNIRIYFKQKLRDVCKFESIDCLLAQIKSETEYTREKYGKSEN